MAIPVECDCGKRFKVADDQAGRKARCPVCQEVVHVPGKAAREDGYGIEAARKCPSCKREWPEDAVVCIECGYNFETGKRMKTTYDQLERHFTFGVSWLGTYNRVTILRDRKGKSSLIRSTRFLFIPLGSRVIELKGYNAVVVDVTLGHSDGENSSPDVYYLDLEGPKKRPVRILKTTDEEGMHAVVDALKEAARLEIKRR
jgi:hypothetical protein